eukprot:TRINITY_DN4991_c0_g1_i1.p1 TRINITY_DN4991_c0_g1~~TRINITY_DN4991_c0_g1_i1.p1  ORF type:complete len:1331 (+),score=329.11 TRINITY_DN4991_c0_g1_i1:371-4363(+)
MSQSLNDISQFLLNNSYLLTALELYQESLERGNVIQSLNEYFLQDEYLNNLPKLPNRVQSSKEHLTEDAYQNRISLLEYDLRQERQNLQTLRAELQNLLPSELQVSDPELTNSPTTTFERNTLNYCVQKYLIDAGFKLTAISFSQEANEDSLDDWRQLGELYGIKDFKPPNLRLLYRYFVGRGANKYEFGFKEALDKSIQENQTLTKQLEELRGLLSETNEQLTKYKDRYQHLKEENETLSKKVKDLSIVPPLKDNLKPPSGITAVVNLDVPVKSTPKKPILIEPLAESFKTPERNSLATSQTIESSPPNQASELSDSQSIQNTTGVNSSQPQIFSPSPALPDTNTSTVQVVTGEQSSDKDQNEETTTTKPSTTEYQEQTISENPGSEPEQNNVNKIEENKEEPSENQTTSPSSSTIATASTTTSTSTTTTTEETSINKKERNFSSLFKSDDISHSGYIAQQVFALRSVQSSSQLIDIISQSLPRITKGVILNKRDELLPVLLVAICWNPDEKQRLNLTHLLFNLIKIPNEEQRRVIMAGCVWLATLSDQDRTANELLPQCWEQIDSAYEERRILVAESCGSLAPHVKPELRLSLLLSILLELSPDPQPLVREAVSKNLAKLLLTEKNCDHTKKYSQLEEFVIKFLRDDSHDTRETTKRILLPIFLDWCDFNSHFRDPFLNNRLQRLIIIIERNHSQKNVIIDQKDKADLIFCLDLLSSCMPQLNECILSDTPSYYEDLMSVLSQRPAASINALTPPTEEKVNDQNRGYESDGSDSSGAGDDSDGERFVIVNMPKPEDKKEQHQDESSTDQSKSTNTPPSLPIAQQQQNLLQKLANVEAQHSPRESTKKFIENDITIYHVSLYSPEEKLTLINQFESTLEILLDQIKNAPAEIIPKASHVNWIVSNFLPKVITQATMIDPINTDVYLALCRLFSSMCTCLGRTFSRVVLKQIFEERLSKTRSSILHVQQDTDEFDDLVQTRGRLMSLYICGVLAHDITQDMRTVEEKFKELIVHIALEEDYWKESNYMVVATSFTTLCQLSPGWEDLILSLLWDLVVHPANRVRALIIRFFSVMSREVLDESQIGSRVLPALITLSNDIHKVVRTATISAYGDLTTIITSPILLDKIQVQLQTLIENSSRKMQREIVRVFGKIIPDVNPDFRDQFILKQLLVLANKSTTLKKASKRKKMMNLLIPAYKALAGCELTLSIQQEYIMPVLEIVNKETALLEPHEKNVLSDLIAERKESIQKLIEQQLKEKEKEEKEKLAEKQNASTANNEKKEHHQDTTEGKDSTNPQSSFANITISRFTSFWNRDKEKNNEHQGGGSGSNS